MLTALRFPYNPRDAETAIKNFLSLLTKTSSDHLNVITKIYIQKNKTPKRDFRAIAKKTFLTDIESTDFTNRGEATKLINDFVKKHSENQIENLIDPRLLSPDMNMVLVSTAFFRGSWLKPFQSACTESQNFFKSATNVVKVDMMGITGHFNYFENVHVGAKFLELRFEDESMAMVIALPDEKEGLAKVETRLDAVFLNHSYSLENLKVRLPRFKIESLIDFKPIMQSMGMEKAFTSHADFRGIFDNKSDGFINLVLQKCIINVGEGGLQLAPAVNSDLGMKTSVSLTPIKVKLFTADHPFLFFVKVKDLVILTGRVLSPVA